MSQNSNYNSGSGPDFNITDDILAVIPTDPYDQLDLARKITSMAIASRVSKLESEVGRLRQMMYEKDRVAFDLEEKVSQLERAYQESESRLKMVIDENVCIWGCLVCEKNGGIGNRKLKLEFLWLGYFGFYNNWKKREIKLVKQIVELGLVDWNFLFCQLPK